MTIRGWENYDARAGGVGALDLFNRPWVERKFCPHDLHEVRGPESESNFHPSIRMHVSVCVPARVCVGMQRCDRWRLEEAATAEWVKLPRITELTRDLFRLKENARGAGVSLGREKMIAWQMGVFYAKTAERVSRRWEIAFRPCSREGVVRDE